MNDTAYRNRLAADLPKWRAAGWVTADGAAAILAAAPGRERRTGFGLVAILGTIGALLLGLGVIAFVGSNWETMPRLLRLGAIAAAMAIAYGVAFEFDRRGHRIFAEAATLAGGLVFAGGIALVGQMYHLAGDFGGALLVFEIGILGAALLTGSPTMTLLGLVAAGYWVWFGTIDHDIVPHWPSLIAILVGVVAATFQNSHYGRIVAVLAFLFWTTITIGGTAEVHDWSFAGGMMVFVTAALAVWAFGAAAATVAEVPRLAALGQAILWPGLLAILLTVGLLQVADMPTFDDPGAIPAAAILFAVAVVLTAGAIVRRGLMPVDGLAVIAIGAGAMLFAIYLPDAELWQRVAGGAIVIVAAIWAVSLGQSGVHPVGKALGLTAFGLEIIYLYVRTFGTLLDTALAFLGGGLLFVILAFVLYRTDRMLAARNAAAPPVATPAPTPEPPVIPETPAAPVAPVAPAPPSPPAGATP